MIFYKLDYAIEKILNEAPSVEQKRLEELTGKVLPKNEAEKIWLKLQDHKWYLSERLRRDVGLRVAAVDYLENFYQPRAPRKQNLSGKLRRAGRPLTFAA